MSVKSDLMKQIEASVQRKKDLVKEMARERTVSDLVAGFFQELERIRNFHDSQYLPAMLLGLLRDKLRSIDSGVHAELIAEAGEEYRIEIQWSPQYVEKYSCEPITVLDVSTALFQSAMEKLS
jgi:hypothetical protein